MKEIAPQPLLWEMTDTDIFRAPGDIITALFTWKKSHLCHQMSWNIVLEPFQMGDLTYSRKILGTPQLSHPSYLTLTVQGSPRVNPGRYYGVILVLFLAPDWLKLSPALSSIVRDCTTDTMNSVLKREPRRGKGSQPLTLLRSFNHCWWSQQ